MHIDCLQVYDTTWTKPCDCVPFSENEMYDCLRSYVDYVAKYPNQTEAIDGWLKALEEYGCSVNYKDKTFTIIDHEDFAKCCLGWSEEHSGKLSELDVSTYKDLAEVLCTGMSNVYRRFPTIIDGCGYQSLFDAVKHDLYSIHFKADSKKTYKLVAVADCHF